MEENKMTQNEIKVFFHCKKCLEEIPDGVSPREWVRMEVGYTELGLQVWCTRHEENVIHIDFLGQQVDIAEQTRVH
jgi:hypothetical protein